jgi:hypothetical protein
MDNVVWSEDTLVAGREDDSAGDEINQVDVDETLGRSILSLSQNETQVRIDVLEKHRPVFVARKKYLQFIDVSESGMRCINRKNLE